MNESKPSSNLHEANTEVQKIAVPLMATWGWLKKWVNSHRWGITGWSQIWLWPVWRASPIYENSAREDFFFITHPGVLPGLTGAPEIVLTYNLLICTVEHEFSFLCVRACVFHNVSFPTLFSASEFNF